MSEMLFRIDAGAFIGADARRDSALLAAGLQVQRVGLPHPTASSKRSPLRYSSSNLRSGLVPGALLRFDVPGLAASTMQRLGIDGVFGAVNAFAVDGEGQFAYLFDPRVGATIRVNLSTGTRDVLVWYDRSFRHRRWLCYCMFAVKASGSTFLPTLFYNTKRKQFVLETFVTDCEGRVLYAVQESAVATDRIPLDRLSYNAHVDDHTIHMIFYERFTRHASPQATQLPYVYCKYDCQSHRTTMHKGALPEGQWELPFIAHQHLHFISTERSSTQLASIPVSRNLDGSVWDIRVVSSDGENAVPPRKAVWCNAWREGMAWYVVSEKLAGTDGMVQKITIWQMDVLDCQWRLLPVSLEAPATARNFALRIVNNNLAYLHIDWDREAVFYKFDFTELMVSTDILSDAASRERDQARQQ
ncbi:unnamed protein product [Gongylonema pulchrum]|uniref:DPPIV_N domain-containing protein n=1 Tax=Gongylonema pulchrum TaxID=637853 RepID=A0A183ECQ1_9BILA|nr:unnamed protein product [Gongylonema pulchrum]